MTVNTKENFYLYAPRPLDAKTMKETLQGARPYTSITEANAEIIYNHRYIGLNCFDR